MALPLSWRKTSLVLEDDDDDAYLCGLICLSKVLICKMFDDQDNDESDSNT